MNDQKKEGNNNAKTEKKKRTWQSHGAGSGVNRRLGKKGLPLLGKSPLRAFKKKVAYLPQPQEGGIGRK